jgi:hypothetical protein
MKVGDKLLGFKWTMKVNKHFFFESMEKFVGSEGTIVSIEPEFNRFKVDFKNDVTESIWYPISEYLSNIRDKKLNELGI